MRIELCRLSSVLGGLMLLFSVNHGALSSGMLTIRIAHASEISCQRFLLSPNFSGKSEGEAPSLSNF